ALVWLRLRRRVTAIVLAFTLGLGTNVLYLAHAVPVAAVTDNSSVFTFATTTSYASPNKDMKQNYTPVGAASIALRQCRTSNNTNVTERSVTAPTMATNDVLIAWSAWTASGVTLTPPSGFTVIDTVSNAASPALVSQMSYRVVTSTVGEPASYSFTSSGAGDAQVTVCSFSGVSTSAPVDVHAAQATPFATTHDTPSVTTTAANDLVLLNWVMGCSAGGVYPFTLPPGVTELSYGYSLGVNQVADLSDYTQASAGATGAKTITLSSTACSSGAPGVTHTVALRSSAPICPSPATNNWTCSWTSDAFSAGQVMNAGTAQADLYLSNNPVPTLRYTSNLAGTSNNVCTLNKPTTVVNGDVMIAACAFRGGSGTTVTSVPSGWSLVGSRVDNSTTISLVVYSHVVTDASSEPASYSWNLSATVKLSPALQSYSGIDNATPIDAAAGQTTPSDTSHSTPSITTTVSKDMLLTYFVTAICAGWTAPPGMTERTDTTFCSQSAGSNVDMSVDEGLLGGAGAVPALTATNTDAAVGITMAVALKRDAAPKTCNLTVQLTKSIVHRSSASAVVNNTGTSITIDKPAGVVDGDVMVASIGMNSASTTITPQDAGWTFVSRALNGAGSSVAVYVQVASGEPANYTWDVSATQFIIGAISAYSGVDTTTPVDTSGILATGGANPTTASITTAQAAEMIVVSFFAWTSGSASTWTPPSGMAERVEAATTSGFYSYELADAVQPLAGATGAKPATATPSTGSGASHILALRPVAGSVLGSATASISSAGPTLVSASIATPAVTFADGDRLQVTVIAPSDPVNCASSISFDHPTTPSKLTVATIVPEGVAGLLLLAPALPVGLRWWKRRRP
ncbi:MAG TPA: hypothetical protein VGR85_14705, partial [Candidatus Limnocylindria bacterium]|nr:hypothetical protein [Candidatus Limnocylindria bacterium]